MTTGAARPAGAATRARPKPSQATTSRVRSACGRTPMWKWLAQRQGAKYARELPGAVADVEFSDAIVGRGNRLLDELGIVQQLGHSLGDLFDPSGARQADALSRIGHLDDTGHRVGDARNPERHALFDRIRIELRERGENQEPESRDRFECFDVTEPAQEPRASGDAQLPRACLQSSLFRAVTDDVKFQERSPPAQQLERAECVIHRFVVNQLADDSDAGARPR